MRVLHTALLAAGLAAFVTAASAQTQPTTSPTSPAVSPNAGNVTTPAPAPDAADDTITCRYEKTTGSLFARRVCHTVREWRQMEQSAHDMLNRLDDGSGRQVNPSGG
jgi:hypothetical protein